MNFDYKIIYAKDLEDESVGKCMERIKENNPQLYDSLRDNLQKESSLGIREDVLSYISEHIEEFDSEQEYVFNIAALMGNIKISADYFAWINRYFREINKISISDFVIVFDEAVEKDIPLEVIMEFFSSDEDDVLKIYDKVDKYTAEEKDASEKADDAAQRIESDKKAQENENQNPQIHTVDVENSHTGDMQDENSEMADMFKNLLTVMTYCNRDTGDSVLNIQDNINAILAKFQLAMSEMTSYSTNIVRDWEKDKEEIERLKALNEIQQKVIRNQQTKMNEMRSQLVRTNENLQALKLSEIRSEALKQKISELDTLVSEFRHPFDGNMRYIENL